ncbi:MAG: penicillin acylase family protein, partial [Acidobacteriota bacterium]
FSVPGAAGFEHLGEALEGLPRSGGYEVVDASGHFVLARGSNDFLFNGGAARRFVGVLDPAGIRAEQILPGGQSGQLGHPHYASQLGRWLTVDYHPLLLDPAAIAADTASELRFEPSACGSSETTLCFQGERFAATLAWRSPDRGAGAGRVVPGGTDASGNFYFFTPDNWEMLVKVLDGCGVNGHYWVYASGASDVEWELEVEDLRTEARWSVSNPLGRRSPAITDTAAFPCRAP